MDNKITKERVNIHLEYDWIKYIAALALAIFLFALLYTTLAPRLKTHEEIKFLILARVSESSDGSKDGWGQLAADMQVFFNEKAEESGSKELAVKNVGKENMLPEGASFGEWLTTRLLSNFDFVIAPDYFFLYDENKPDTERVAYEGNLAPSVVRFSQWKDENDVPYIDTARFPDALLINSDNECVGLILNGFETIYKLLPDVKNEPEETRYALAVLQSGGNIGALNKTTKREAKKGIDNSVHNQALDALEYFIKRYSGAHAE